MERAFVDTSAWVAFVDAKDAAHRAVKAAITKWKDRIVTTNFVLDETVTLCRYECGHEIAIRVADRLMDGKSVQMVRVTPDDEAQALDLLRKRKDKEYSFTDCTSFIVMKRLGITRAITTDSDFRQEGFDSLP